MAGRFGAPIVPFPVRPPYLMRPDLVRLGRSDPAIDPGPATLTRVDDERPRYLAERAARLRDVPHLVCAVDPQADHERLHAAGWAIAAALGLEQPELLRVEGERLVLPDLGIAVERSGAVLLVGGGAPGLVEVAAAVASRLEAVVPPLRPLEAIVSTVQEDLVVMQGGGEGRAAYLHVAFPSGWDPSRRAGASFLALHDPVPESAALREAARAMVAAMVTKGPFVRYVWSVSEGLSLDRHPVSRAAHASASAPAASLLGFRAERQTTVPLEVLGMAAFLIRIYVAPLEAVVAEPGRRAALASALSSMSPAVRRYKGVTPALEGAVGALLRSSGS
jgi:hypothetical protein